MAKAHISKFESISLCRDPGIHQLASEGFRDLSLQSSKMPFSSSASTQIKTIYVASVDTACMSCSVGNTPCMSAGNLNVSSEQQMYLVRKHQPCFNCLQSSNFKPQRSDQKCQKCCKPYHILLHSQFECDGVAKTTGQHMKQSLPAKTDHSSTSHSSHLSCLSSGGQHSALMMTCQIVVVALDGRVLKRVAFHHHSSRNNRHSDCNCLISTSVFKSLALVTLGIHCHPTPW